MEEAKSNCVSSQSPSRGKIRAASGSGSGDQRLLEHGDIRTVPSCSPNTSCAKGEKGGNIELTI